MKAMLYDQPKAPLYLGDADEPQPSSGELLVRVHAAGVNRADLLQHRGGYAPPPGASPILGLEIAGEVVRAAGAWKIGDRVMAVVTGGGYAEYVTVPAEVALRIPDTFDFVQAAAVPEAFLTAHLNMFTLGNLRGGESILVHAGGSGVGSAAIQLAKAVGARVFTTAGSDDKLDQCRKLGADVTINYKSENFLDRVRAETGGSTESSGVNVILDFVGAPYWNDNLAALAIGGRLLLIGFLGGASGSLDLGAIMSKSLTITGTTLRRTRLPQKAALVRAFADFGLPHLANGDVKPIVDRVFPLAQAQEAHQYMASNSNFGKIVLRIESD